MWGGLFIQDSHLLIYLKIMKFGTLFSKLIFNISNFLLFVFQFFIDLDDQIQALYFEQEEVQRKLTRKNKLDILTKIH